MKKIYASLLTLLVSSMMFAQNGQIQNGGFENWATDTLYETPVQWKTSNTEEFRGVSLVNKITGGQDQVYAIQLNNSVINGDSLFGYFYHGAVTSGGQLKGMPYSSPFDAVNGYWKGTTAGNDSAYVICIKSFMGSQYPPVIAAIGGSAASWTAFSFPITAGPCDSVFIGIVSSNPFNNSNFNAANAIDIDNIYFTNSGPPPLPLPNFSFENWTFVSVDEPDYWNSLNFIIAGSGQSFVTQTTDAYTGSGAAQIQTLQIAQFNNDTIPGFITNGTIGQLGSPNPFIPIAYNASPVNFSGYYKYTPVGIDGSFIAIDFFQAGASIGGYSTNINSAAASYTLIGGPVNLTGVPDSMIIVVQSGNNPGSVLKIDDFMLTGGNVGIQEMARKLGFKTYPNPTEGILFLEWNSDLDGDLQLEITDMTGRVVFIQTLYTIAGDNYTTLDLTFLSAATYGYRVYGSDVILTGKVAKE